ncbi:arsenate reductase/protein-tyrosine-phosphatase family protein [Phycisphaera mikurensis]|uniref:protein-tyrosine-phosphatase n=1 Tax=Phycisphaera mikurensis (strain NBRC 102666 / KCTC 22515 / FYK2301M01) TaxID=1142394 RepID=I0IGR3_PHYMF|nr:Sua5/YciO/YrdC/YwlC family protein [Phycisphaera mikurensis]MBB6443240.1 protein-tyrosine phosphatase [Phycisphaera mikurensis]BAM04451.1 putative low molecular weight protein-tyrosine-phosphatase [Phycisphaera mikurensis NBRC 102666]
MEAALTPTAEIEADRSDAPAVAAAALDRGEAVVLPTETVYGLFLRADRPDAVARVRRERGLVDGQALALQVPDAAAAASLAPADPAVGRFLRRAMPGAYAVTLDADAASLASRAPDEAARGVFARGGRVAVRCPEPRVTRRAVAAAGGPVVALPAVDAAGRQVVDPRERPPVGADLVVLGGPARFGRGSTAVRLFRPKRADGSRGRLRASVLRAGVYAPRIVERLNRLHILFVCTGNTCRSPMAEAFARQAVADGGGGVTVSSAGVSAVDGYAASPEAVAEAAGAGGGLADHRSHALTAQAVVDADVIYTLTADHLDLLVSRFPDAASKASRLDPGADVSDPIGGDAEDYRRAADQIRAAVGRRLAELAP